MSVTTDHPNVTTVHAMTDAVFNQDHDALAKIFTDDLVFHFRAPHHPMNGDHRGLGGFLGVLGSIFEATNGQIELDTKYCLGTDGWAAEFESARLTRNGRTITSENTFAYRFEGDRIAEMWMHLGLMPDVAEAFFS